MPAVVTGDATLTYADLDRWSDALADALAEQGVQPGQVVPVVISRSPALIGMVLAVLKLGAAYSVLDPAWPAQWLRAAAGRVAPGGMTVLGPGVSGEPFERVWTAPEPAARIPAAPPRPMAMVDATDPAMVFFTSGTTGEPKAVPSPHQGTTRLTIDCPFAVLGPGAVMPQLSAASWDAFALELWAPLTTGGTCVVPDEPLLTPGGLRSLIRRHGVNTIFLTTSLFHLLVEEDVGAFAGLAVVLVGGERLSPALAARFVARHSNVRLVNGYGPVESTIFALWHEVVAPDSYHEVPLGRPCPRTRVLVLDGDRECGVGEIGEICVAGDGLTRGYLGEPELTAEKFVRHTVGGESLRLYRTGDRGSVDTDGVFHFAGRGDRQVKVRGHRVEPAGVERAAEAVPGVRRAVVVPVTNDGYLQSLALFYRPDVAGPSEVDLTAALRAVLPAYSMPETVVQVDGFPLTANGKLDTRQLVAAHERPGAAGPGRGGVELPPTPTVVVNLMAEVLGRDRPDPDVPFFALGGSSLAAVRLCSRLSTAFGHAVPVSQLVRTPTASALADWLDRHVPSASGPAGDLRLTAAQQSFLVASLNPDTDAANHCLLAWELTGPVDVAALAAAVGDVHARHPYLSAAYDLADGIARPNSANVDFRTVPADGLIRTLMEPFDPAEGRVWRVAVAANRTGARLALAVHHVAFDGQAQHILARDLGMAYTARLAGRDAFPGPADPRPMLALIEQARSQSDEAAQRAYWTATLAGLPDLALGPAAADGTSAPVRQIPLSRETIAAVDRIARQLSCGRVAVLLHEVAEVLGAVIGQEDFGIGVPVSQRLGQAADQVVGCLIDTICVRARPGHPDGASASVAALSAAIAHSELPFAEVVRACGVQPVGGRTPLYQAMVAVQDAPEPVLTLPGVVVRPEIPITGAPPVTGLSVELVPEPAPVLRVHADPRQARPGLAVEVAAQVAARLAALR